MFATCLGLDNVFSRLILASLKEGDYRYIFAKTRNTNFCCCVEIRNINIYQHCGSLNGMKRKRGYAKRLHKSLFYLLFLGSNLNYPIIRMIHFHYT